MRNKIVSIFYWFSVVALYAFAIKHNVIMGFSFCILHALASVAHRENKQAIK